MQTTAFRKECQEISSGEIKIRGVKYGGGVIGNIKTYKWYRKSGALQRAQRAAPPFSPEISPASRCLFHGHLPPRPEICQRRGVVLISIVRRVSKPLRRRGR